MKMRCLKKSFSLFLGLAFTNYCYGDCKSLTGRYAYIGVQTAGEFRPEKVQFDLHALQIGPVAKSVSYVEVMQDQDGAIQVGFFSSELSENDTFVPTLVASYRRVLKCADNVWIFQISAHGSGDGARIDFEALYRLYKDETNGNLVVQAKSSSGGGLFSKPKNFNQAYFFEKQ